MDAFLASLSLVTFAEIGDKTQLLSLLLAAKYKKPIPIILAILIATTLNHALAAALGNSLKDFINPTILHWMLGLSFVFIGLWVLLPDSLTADEEEGDRRGAFIASFIAFFLAEMGDKTQFATIALGAQYNDLLMVVAGTTVGMMIANVPAVFLGNRLLNLIPLRTVRMVSSAMFVLFGLWELSRLV